ncbi:MAG: LysR family transcriptional regulator [Hyphomicrobiaceae bacterium]|nr:LysR family transcriptional regulator [Hyphomicrobiaceae bacterium]
MNLQQLKYVVAVAEEGSFVAAAARCANTQPTLSNAIAQLEAELGHKIFNRTTRSVQLTIFGATLLPAIREILSGVGRITELAERHGRGATGTIKIGFSPVVGVAQATRVLQRFTSQHSDVSIVYREENLDDLCKLLRNQQLDLVLAPVDLRSPDLTDCVYTLIQRDPLLFVPKQAHESTWLDHNEVELAALAREEFVLVPDACGLTRVTKRHFNDENITLQRYPGEASSYRVVGEWAALGLGAGILPASKVAEELKGRVAIPIVNHARPVTIDYFAFGKPNTITRELFAELWQSLIEAHPENEPQHRPTSSLSISKSA